MHESAAIAPEKLPQERKASPALPTSALAKWSRQTPAGEAVHIPALACSMARQHPGQSGAFDWVPFQSGTMSLAAALLFASHQLNPAAPVVLPAYSCPDHLAAALDARLPIRFVDLAPSLTCPSTTSIADKLQGNPHIVVAVDLFGSASPLQGLRTACEPSKSTIVHDCAQSIAGPGIEPSSEADLVVASFGRGKPTTLLGGGATWARDFGSFSSFAVGTFPSCRWHPTATLVKALSYNLALTPSIFGLVSRVPLADVGKTAFRNLRAIRRLPSSWLLHVADQIEFQRRQINARRARTVRLLEQLHAFGFAVPLDAAASAYATGLNRLPIICRDPEQAAMIAAAGKPLGISAMYGRTLPEFFRPVCDNPVDPLLYPNALDFSRRLVTVPTHSRILDDAQHALLSLFRDA